GSGTIRVVTLAVGGVWVMDVGVVVVDLPVVSVPVVLWLWEDRVLGVSVAVGMGVALVIDLAWGMVEVVMGHGASRVVIDGAGWTPRSSWPWLAATTAAATPTARDRGARTSAMRSSWRDQRRRITAGSPAAQPRCG
ncbi:MAG TPA: hypothetical protein VHM23_02040, partial [Actinomycetota bacterium]|nr:hypothetical protein [Actinomycetota bacterium]